MEILPVDPPVTAEKRLEVIRLEQGFPQVIVNYGFMQSPNVQR